MLGEQTKQLRTHVQARNPKATQPAGATVGIATPSSRRVPAKRRENRSIARCTAVSEKLRSQWTAETMSGVPASIPAPTITQAG